MSKISIYIPTYHRPTALQRCLRSIADECYRFGCCDIEICVSNNDRYDEKTKLVVQSFKKLYPRLKYYENFDNIGIDGNMRKAFEMTEGMEEAEWCLMLGDDDELNQGAFNIFFKAVDLHNDVTFILLNWLTSKGIANNWEDGKLYLDAVQCFSENHDKMPYGTIIFNKKYAQTVSKEEKDRFMGTYHLYSGVLWDMALVGKKILRIGLPCVSRGEEEKTYVSYVDDVLLRGIPEWYDRLAEPYQPICRAIKLKKQLDIKEMSNRHLALFLMMNKWVKVKQEGKNLSVFFERNGYKRIAIYGMSYAGTTLLNELKGTPTKVMYGIDKNTNLVEKVGIIVCPPDNILEEVDAVVVTAITFFTEIKDILSKKLYCPIVSLDEILDEV